MYAAPQQSDQPSRPPRRSRVRTGIAAASLVAAGANALPGIGRLYSSAAIAAPLSCAVGTAAAKGVASDLFAQIVVERKWSDISLSRTLAFASFGAVYLGALASWKYNTLYAAMFGSSTALSVILSKVGLDIFISGPLIYFPLYFIVKGLFAGQGPFHSLREYLSANGMSILRRYWMVWLPVEMLMWFFVPAHLRIAYLCTVSLVWQVFLSTHSYGCSPDVGCEVHSAEAEEQVLAVPTEDDVSATDGHSSEHEVAGGSSIYRRSYPVMCEVTGEAASPISRRQRSSCSSSSSSRSSSLQ